MQRAAERRGGAGLLKAEIRRRVDNRQFGDWTYLLVDPSRAAPLAGNLNAWPQALRGERGWREFSVSGRGPGSRIKAAYLILPGGDRLLVGRDLSDLENFDRSIALALGTAVGLLILLAAAAGVRLRVSGEDGMHVIGDRDLLFDALSNLVDNAIHHGGRDGLVTITTAHDGAGLTVAAEMRSATSLVGRR